MLLQRILQNVNLLVYIDKFNARYWQIIAVTLMFIIKPAAP